MLRISHDIVIPRSEIELRAIRASGPGGQHGDKASTAVHLRFDFERSSLPERYKRGLRAMADERIAATGVIVIKAQAERHRWRNERDALERLRALLDAAGREPRPRRKTGPSKRDRRRRLEAKRQRGRRKALRRPPTED